MRRVSDELASTMAQLPVVESRGEKVKPIRREAEGIDRTRMCSGELGRSAVVGSTATQETNGSVRGSEQGEPTSWEGQVEKTHSTQQAWGGDGLPAKDYGNPCSSHGWNHEGAYSALSSSHKDAGWLVPSEAQMGLRD